MRREFFCVEAGLAGLARVADAGGDDAARQSLVAPGALARAGRDRHQARQVEDEAEHAPQHDRAKGDDSQPHQRRGVDAIAKPGQGQRSGLFDENAQSQRDDADHEQEDQNAKHRLHSKGGKRRRVEILRPRLKGKLQLLVLARSCKACASSALAAASASRRVWAAVAQSAERRERRSGQLLAGG